MAKDDARGEHPLVAEGGHHRHATHVNDDELAVALEAQFGRPSGSGKPAHDSEVSPPPSTAPLAALSDAEVVERIGAEMNSTGDTLGAIAKLEQVLAVRAQTTSIPILEPQRSPSDSDPSTWIAPAAFLAEPFAADEVALVGTPSLPAEPVVEPPKSLPLTTASVVLVPVVVEPAESQSVPDDAYDRDVADDADDVPVAFEEVLAPRASPRVGTDEEVLFDAEDIRRPVFRVEQPALEPTPLDYRVGRAARMFWLWFAATNSVITVGIGAILFSLGLTVLQVIIATLIGIVLSFLPIGLGTLAGKWSGQPTMVVSRATFGVVGNVVPAALTVLTRIFWGAAILWIVGTSIGTIATGTDASVSRTAVEWVGALVVLALALVVAFFGYSFVARIQLIISIASAIVVGITIAATLPAVRWGQSAVGHAAPWPLVAGGAVIVFSFLGLLWANSSSDLARYQRPGSSGTSSMAWANLGAAVPPLILISYGAVLAASDPALASGLRTDPVASLADFGLPWWYSIVLLLAVVLGLGSSLVITIYSGGFALQSLGVRLPRQFAALIVGILIGGCALLLTANVDDLGAVVGEIPITLAVPVAAWSGIFGAEMIIRKRRFNPESLLRRGGVYADWRWVNLIGLVIASVIGFGFVRGDLGWLRWEGFLFSATGSDQVAGLSSSNLGVIVALVLGLATPFLFGRRAVRAQENTSR